MVCACVCVCVPETKLFSEWPSDKSVELSSLSCTATQKVTFLSRDFMPYCRF